MSEKNKSSWFRKKGEAKQVESRVDSSDSKEKLKKAIGWYDNGLYILQLNVFVNLQNKEIPMLSAI
jgi:hypothetical protein